MSGMMPYEVAAVKYDDRSRLPLIELRENAGRKAFAIFVGKAGAQSLMAALDPANRGVCAGRPLSHELTLALAAAAGWTVARVEVVAITEAGTFVATVVLVDGQGDEKAHLDARPSDGLALALAAGAPVFVSDAVAAEVKTYAAATSPYREIQPADLGYNN
jgi:hypothetical protein